MTAKTTDRDRDWAAALAAANAGDARAYARFLHAVTPVLRGVIRARGRSFGPDQQEDILQEVLLAIHAKRHTWDPAAPVAPWLYAIARYKVVDAFRRRGAAVHLPIEDFAEGLAAPEADPTAARDSAALIGQLDPRSAEIVRAVSLAGESTAEVGARMEMSEGAVRVALHRAIQRMARFAKGERG